MNVINELADVEFEGTKDPFIDTETDTPSDSPAENEPEADKPVEVETPKEGEPTADEPVNTPEDNLPFHKHPRWIEREKELEELRAFKETIEPKLSEFDQVKSQMETTKNEIIPEWFVELYGDNEKAWAKYSERETLRDQEIEQRAIERFEKQQEQKIAEAQAAQQAQEEAQANDLKFVEDGFKSLESQGKQFNRNELAKFMLDNPITDNENNLDFAKSFNLFEKLQVPKDTTHTQARKQLADDMTKNPVEKRQEGVMTSNDFRNKGGWRGIIGRD